MEKQKFTSANTSINAPKMKTKPTIKKVYNIHVNDKYGVTISNKFTVYYESGVVRSFKCRNKLSENVLQFIQTHDATGSAMTDKNQTTTICTTWSKGECEKTHKTTKVVWRA